MKVAVDGGPEFIRVRIDDVLHLHIDRTRLLAVQSWKYPGRYTIEFTTECGTVLCEYASETTWLLILAGLDTLL